MDRQALEQRIEAYTHRFSAFNADILSIIEDARMMIAQDLRSLYNWTAATIAFTDGKADLPADFIELTAFNGPDGQMLEYVTSEYAASWRDESGTPQYFSIKRGVGTGETQQLRAYPVQDGNYSMFYFHAPADLPLTTSENSVLTNLPFLYIAACMVLASAWGQDAQGISTWTQLYDEQINRANRAFKRARVGRDAVQQATQAFAAQPVKGA